MKKYLILLILAWLTVSCSKLDSRQSPSGAGSATASGRMPEIVAASFYPEIPTAQTPIIVQYKLRDPGTVSCTFRWYVDNQVVQEGAAGTLDPGKYFKGSDVYVEIIPANQNGSGNTFRSASVKAGNVPPSVTSISLKPDQPGIGTVVAAAAEGTDPDNDQVSFLYQWFVNAVPVSEPKPENQFNTKGLKKGDQVAVVVTPFDGTDKGPTRQSDIIVLVNSSPRITSVPPTSLGNGVYTYQVAATDPDGDKLAFSLESAPQGMTIDPASGLIRWTPGQPPAGRQEIPVKIKVDDGNGGTFYQSYSLFLQSQ